MQLEQPCSGWGRTRLLEAHWSTKLRTLVMMPSFHVFVFFFTFVNGTAPTYGSVSGN